LTERPDAGSPSFRRSPFARDVFSDPGRATVPRITAPLMLRSTLWTVSAPATSLFRGSIDTPCNRCVRFVAVVAAGSRNTRYRAARYGLTRPVFHRLDRASLLAPSQSQAWRILVRKLIRRGNFSSKQMLKTRIEQFIAYFNATMARPFRWTYAGKPLAG